MRLGNRCQHANNNNAFARGTNYEGMMFRTPPTRVVGGSYTKIISGQLIDDIGITMEHSTGGKFLLLFYRLDFPMNLI